MVLLNLFHNQGRGRPIGGVQASYADKVLSYSPIAYWPLWEAVGDMAYDISGNGFHGAYTSVTLGQPGIGDGRTCPSFDGSTSFVDVYSTGLRDAFDGEEGTIIVWIKVFDWADGNNRKAVHLEADANNYSVMFQNATNNALYFAYEANNIQKAQQPGGYSLSAFFPIAQTWSLSSGGDGEYKAYVSSAQVGSTLESLGTWAGQLADGNTYIGVGAAAATQFFYGWLAHGMVFDRPLAQPELADLAVI